MPISKDGIEWLLNPFQRLILWGLWAILAHLHGDGDRPINRDVRNELYEGAAHGFVTENLLDKSKEKREG